MTWQNHHTGNAAGHKQVQQSLHSLEHDIVFSDCKQASDPHHQSGDHPVNTRQTGTLVSTLAATTGQYMLSIWDNLSSPEGF